MQVQLTKYEADIVDWAIDPMYSLWCDDDGAWSRDGDVYPDSDLPVLTGRTLTLSTITEINEDLQYRIMDQLPQMSDQAGTEMESIQVRKAANRISDKCNWTN